MSFNNNMILYNIFHKRTEQIVVLLFPFRYIFAIFGLKYTIIRFDKKRCHKLFTLKQSFLSK